MAALGYQNGPGRLHGVMELMPRSNVQRWAVCWSIPNRVVYAKSRNGITVAHCSLLAARSALLPWSRSRVSRFPLPGSRFPLVSRSSFPLCPRGPTASAAHSFPEQRANAQPRPKPHIARSEQHPAPRGRADIDRPALNTHTRPPTHPATSTQDTVRKHTT